MEYEKNLSFISLDFVKNWASDFFFLFSDFNLTNLQVKVFCIYFFNSDTNTRTLEKLIPQKYNLPHYLFSMYFSF